MKAGIKTIAESHQEIPEVAVHLQKYLMVFLILIIRYFLKREIFNRNTFKT